MTEFKEPEWIFPFEGMLIGDSFFIPTLDPSHMRIVAPHEMKEADKASDWIYRRSQEQPTRRKKHYGFYGNQHISR